MWVYRDMGGPTEIGVGLQGWGNDYRNRRGSTGIGEGLRNRRGFTGIWERVQK